MHNCVAYIPAAGIGVRMQQGMPKQYLLLAGKPVLQYAIDTLLTVPLIEKIVVALAVDDPYWQALPAASDSRVITCRGGACRAESVLNALQTERAKWALIHDAVRPFLLAADVEQLMLAAKQSSCGAILAQPVTDTVKLAQQTQIQQTIPREQVFLAATPQLFRYQLLLAALLACAGEYTGITDEASALEQQAYQPDLVLGHRHNIKITYPHDLSYAEWLLTGHQSKDGS